MPNPSQPIPAKPQPQYPRGWRKKVSIQIAPTMVVQDVLSEVASKAGLNIHIDKLDNVTNISYKASNISLLRAIKQICRLCNWRLRISSNGDLSIMKDEPYMYEHEVAFLSGMRTLQSSATIGALEKTAGKHILQFNSENSLNLWNEIENNLKFLLQADTDKDTARRFSINKQADMIIVKATQAEHEQIARFLRKIQLRAASQVLIEARIVEIELFDEFTHGINWDVMQVARGVDDYATGAAGAGFNLLQTMTSGLTFLAKFGKAQTLSNPRTAVLNNQHAIFKAVTNQVYFKLKTSYGSNVIGKTVIADPSVKIVDSEPQVVPIGIIFIVQPSINFDNDTISLHIRPTISSVESLTTDPGVTLMGGKVTQQVPITKESSIDTVITVRDRELAVVGGLIRAVEEPGQIGLNKGAFVLKSRSKHNREIVMMVQAKILRPTLSKSHPSFTACEIMDMEDM